MHFDAHSKQLTGHHDFSGKIIFSRQVQIPKNDF